MPVQLEAFVNGDVTTMTQILSQVAIVFKGSAFDVAIKVAALVGIVVGLFGGLSKGQLSPMTFLWPILMTVLLIVPRADLVIEDRFGGLSKVDDLPIGFAAPVSIMTLVGRATGDMLTSSLGLDDYSITMDNGHLVALRAPQVFAQVITDPDFQKDAGTFPNGLSPTRDVMAYVEQCVVPAGKGPNSAFRPAVLPVKTLAQWRVNNSATTVGTSNGTVLECFQLYDQLAEGFRSAGYEERLVKAINQSFGKYKNDTTTGPRYLAALQAIMSDPADFYMVAALSNAMQLAPAEIVQAAGGGSHKAALNDALAQKREKSFGSAAMIFETITYTMEFLEVWSFSIFPLALMLLVMGGMGVKMGVKYLWMLVWVQFWYPTLLIVMDYLDAKLRTLALGSSITVADYNGFMQEVLRLQDVGYMHLSMATAMSMMLIFGSSAIIASSIQRDLTGSDHYDPKKNAPDTLSRNALTAFHSPFSYSPNQGTVGHASKEAFGGATFTFDRQLASGVSFSEGAQFARTGQRSASTKEGFTEAVTTGAAATATRTATDGWDARASTGSSIGAGMGAGNDFNRGERQSVEESSARIGTGQVGLGANLGAQASGGLDAGWGGKGIGGNASGGIRGDATTSYQLQSRSSASRSEGQGQTYKLDQDVSVDRKADKILSYGRSEQESQGLSSSKARSETGVTGEEVATTAGEGRTDSQVASTSDSATTGRRISTQYDAILVSNQIAGDKDMMETLTRAVHDTGISGQVENWIGQNLVKLENTFGRHNTDAQYAMAAMHVMQGLDGNPYAGQANAQERMDVLNAIGDELMLRTGFGAARGLPANTDMDGFVAGQAGDAAILDEAFGRVGTRYDLSADAVREAVSGIPASGDPAAALANVFARLGTAPGEITQGQGNAILGQMRDDLDREHGPIAADAQSFMDMRHDLGLKGAIRDLYGKNETVREGDVYANFRDNARDGLLTAGDTAPEMLDNRMNELSGLGLTTTDNDLARFMVATQFHAGAVNAGDDERAAAFEAERQAIIAGEPALTAGDTEERLTALAMLGTSETVMRSSLMRAGQEVAISRLEHAMEQATGLEHNSVGQDASLEGVMVAPAGYGPEGGAGGGAVPAGGFVGRLLGFIREHESNGYSDYYRNSPVAPDRPLETMTVNEVRAWQRETLAEQRRQGVPEDHRSSAAGAYQIISGTMDDLVRDMTLSGNEVFDAGLQDRMAVQLMEGRGLSAYLNGPMGQGDMERFGNSLAGEWAALPRVSGEGAGRSAHDGVGTNAARASVDEFVSLLKAPQRVEI